MSLATAGAYLKELRKRRKLSQIRLGAAVDVSRSTIDRLEKGDPTVGIGTVMQALDILSASPRHYYDLAMHASLTDEDVSRRQAVLGGIQTYVRVMCEQKQIGVDVLSDVMYMPSGALVKWISDPTSQLSELALLLALVYLDVPLTDIAELVHATHDHDMLGRRLAEDRAAYAAQLRQREHSTRSASRRVPALETISRRLAVIVRNSQELPPVLKHELARIVDDLDHYHTRMSVGLESMMSSL
jgi:transcriptional regulator with XRE-family HTH domain